MLEEETRIHNRRRETSERFGGGGGEEVTTASKPYVTKLRGCSSVVEYLPHACKTIGSLTRPPPVKNLKQKDGQSLQLQGQQCENGGLTKDIDLSVSRPSQQKVERKIYSSGGEKKETTFPDTFLGHLVEW